jgi:DNA-binding transcriptional LysR family regulator
MLRNLTRIQHALIVARTRNFARTAEIVHISQPALSRSIAALERELGVRLFDRLSSGVELTTFGTLLVERGGQLLDDIALFEREIDLLAELKTGSLSVATGPYAGESIVGGVIARLLVAHPGVHIRVDSLNPRDAVAGVLEGRHDVGVVSLLRLRHQPQLIIETLEPHAVHFFCRAGHPLCDREDLDIGQVLQHPLVAGPMTGEIAEFARANGASGAPGTSAGDGGEFQPTIQVNSLELARAVVARSDAVMPATLGMVSDDVAQGRLMLLNVALPVVLRPCHFHRRGRSPSPAAFAFMRMLREADAEVAAAERSLTEPAGPRVKARTARRMSNGGPGQAGHQRSSK